MIQQYFTITPDFNSPPFADGTRDAHVRGKFLVKSIMDGGVVTGDRIVLYFDPEGDTAFPYEGGWSSIGTVLDTTTEVVEKTGETWAIIRYREEEL